MFICVNSEFGVRLICKDIGGQIGKLPMFSRIFLWQQKPSPKSIGPAAEYIDFDRQSKCFSFNLKKMKKNTSVEEFKHFKDVVCCGAIGISIFIVLEFLWFYYFVSHCFLLWYNNHPQFRSTHSFGYNYAVFIMGYVTFVFFALVVGLPAVPIAYISCLSEHLQKVIKLKIIERNAFSSAKFCLTKK